MVRDSIHINPRPAAIIVFAATVVADDANRSAVCIGRHDCVETVGLAGATVILE
jgi:hypothetical protein